MCPQNDFEKNGKLSLPELVLAYTGMYVYRYSRDARSVGRRQTMDFVVILMELNRRVSVTK